MLNKQYAIQIYADENRSQWVLIFDDRHLPRRSSGSARDQTNFESADYVVSVSLFYDQKRIEACNFLLENRPLLSSRD